MDGPYIWSMKKETRIYIFVVRLYTCFLRQALESQCRNNV